MMRMRMRMKSIMRDVEVIVRVRETVGHQSSGMEWPTYEVASMDPSGYLRGTDRIYDVKWGNV